MYNSIKGFVAEKGNGFVCLDNNGIEFMIHTSEISLKKIEDSWTWCKMYVYLNHTEKAMTLYGFIDHQERNLFLKLIKVDGIGVKVALKVLSVLTVVQFTKAIDAKNIEALCKVPGLGTKSAAKLIQKIKI